MKTKIGILVLALSTSFFSVQGQRRVVTTARATSYDISDNLDLDAVASIFGDSENLEDFERRLNDPDNRISNLDLNQDGYIDYLRVLENSSDRNSLVVVQAVLDKDVYQDVATIEIERISNNNHRIQIVGDSYIYGSNYIIEPVFVRTPLIFSFFWGPRYITYHSPYYWGYYPTYYRYYRPYSPFKYHKHIHVHINRYNTYNRVNERHIHFSGDNYNRIRRSDYASRYPDRTFESRNHGVKNRYELDQRRPNNQVNRQRNNDVNRSNDRQNQYNRPSNTGGSDRQRDVRETRPQVNQEKSGQTQPREYKRESSRNRPENTERQIQQKSDTRNKSFDNRPAPERRSVSTPERSTKRVEAPQRNTAPREKSGSVSNRSKSNSEVKQSSRSTQKSEPRMKNEKKESENNRRR
ncbi:MAG: hypothetical protein A2066_08800 [Bacteroidetes bacterium GWB2_41_8]|nr:MAG: hypothetical protein A2066_08800 [Bacteroidetes bacterium GWB2_41_8]